MKVLHIEDRFHPDMGYQVNYFAEFHDQSIDFNILSSNSFSIWGGTDQDYILTKRDREFEEDKNVKIIRLDSYSISDNKYNLWLKGLFSTIKSINPDVIYVHALELLTTIRVILSKLNNKYLIVSDTHTLMNQQPTGFRGKFYTEFFHRIYIPRLNKKNITVFYTADENKKILLDYYGVKSENVFPCYIGTNFKDYHFDEAAGKEVRKNLKIDIDSPLILYAGKMNNTKKPHLLLQAVKGIEDSFIGEINLLFVGARDNSYIQKNFNVKFKNNIKLHLLNTVSNKELFRYYSAADFVVFPKENTLSALDAQACRLPVIMEEDETNDFRLKEGGLCYKKGNISDLGTKILMLINDRELLKKLSENGYGYVKTNFDYANIVKQMEKVLEEKLIEF